MLRLLCIAILHSLLPSVFLNAHAQEIVSTKNSCNILYKEFTTNPELNYVIKKIVKGKERTTIAATHINKKNFQTIFSHEYSPGFFGAKALSYIDMQGNLHTVFWSTGTGTKQVTQIHHRDILADLMQREAQRIEEKPRIRKIGQKTEEDNWLAYTTAAEEISSIRNNKSIPGNILKRTHGFQLTAQIFRGKFVITHLDVDSSITAAQLSNKTKKNPLMLALFLQKILSSVDPSINFIKSIRVRNWPETKLAEARAHLKKMGINISLIPLL